MATTKKTATKAIAKKTLTAKRPKPITTATELKAIAAKKAAKPPVIVDGERIDAMLAKLCAQAAKDMNKPLKSAMETNAVRWLGTYCGRYADYQEAAAMITARKIGSKEALQATRLTNSRYKKFQELHNFLVCKDLKSDKARNAALEARGIGARIAP